MIPRHDIISIVHKLLLFKMAYLENYFSDHAGNWPVFYCTKQLCKISFESLDTFSSYWSETQNFMKFDFSKWPISKSIFRIMLEIELDLYFIVLNSCAKYHSNPLTRFQVIGRKPSGDGRTHTK